MKCDGTRGGVGRCSGVAGRVVYVSCWPTPWTGLDWTGLDLTLSLLLLLLLKLELELVLPLSNFLHLPHRHRHHAAAPDELTKFYERHYALQDFIVPVTHADAIIKACDEHLAVYPLWLCPAKVCGGLVAGAPFVSLFVVFSPTRLLPTSKRMSSFSPDPDY